METLDYFGSAYCFISFILGALFVLIMNCITAIGKAKEQSNKVHFYVARDQDDNLYLYLGKPNKEIFNVMSWKPIIAHETHFYKYKLNKKDFERLTFEDEPVEVFLNLKD